MATPPLVVRAAGPLGGVKGQVTHDSHGGGTTLGRR